MTVLIEINCLSFSVNLSDSVGPSSILCFQGIYYLKPRLTVCAYENPKWTGFINVHLWFYEQNYLSDWDDTWKNCLYTVYVMHLSSSISRLLFLNLASGIFGQGREENYYIRKVFKSDTNWRKNCKKSVTWKWEAFYSEIPVLLHQVFNLKGNRDHWRPRSSIVLKDDWFLIIQRISWCNSID